jgi:hypothetical protein
MAQEELCNPLTQKDLLDNDIVYPAELPKVADDIPANVSIGDVKVDGPIAPDVVILDPKLRNILPDKVPLNTKSRAPLPSAPVIGKRHLSIVDFGPHPNKVNNYI